MQRREAIAFLFALVAASGATLRIARSTGTATQAAAPMYALTVVTPLVDDDSLGEAAANAAGNDPFRLVNRPASVRYDAKTEGIGGGQVSELVPLRPQLAVKAIVGGPPWQAIVDGLPGQQPGAIVRGGEHFDKLTVRSVGRDTVVIQAPDTTWKLTLKRDRL